MTAFTSSKRLPRAVREQQMLDAAVRVFSRRGFHSANMDEIAELSGVSKPMVYAYHGTKEELFLACLRRESERLMEKIISAPDSSLPPDEQLWRGLKGFFDYVGAHRDGWSVLYRQARSLEPFAGELAAMRRAMVQVITHRLELAVQAHGRPGSRPPGSGRSEQAERGGSAATKDSQERPERGGLAATKDSQERPARSGGAATKDSEDLTSMALTLVGASESLADWLASRPDEDPAKTATRLMNAVWLGAEQLLHGHTWRPHT